MIHGISGLKNQQISFRIPLKGMQYMQSEDIKVAICDDEEFYRSQLDDMVSVYGNEMDVNVSIDLYGNAKELMNNILSKSKEYDLLIAELYISAIQNPIYRAALGNCDKDIIHSIGENKKSETTFTRYEFEFLLNCLKDFIQSKKSKNK